MDLDRQQHHRAAACVIAQQHSFVIFVSLHFHFGKENPEAFRKQCFLLLLFFCLTPSSITSLQCTPHEEVLS
jgi:hypothetical protein